MMTLGTLLVPLLILLVMPAAFASGRSVPVPGRVALEEQLDRLLDRMAHAIDRHPAITSVSCLLLVAVTAPGLMMMQVETDFSRNFRDSSPILQALRFVESELGPAGTWDVSFDVPKPLTSDFLDTTNELTQRLKALNSEGMTLEVVSLTDALNVPPRIGSSIKRLDIIRRRQADLVESFYNPEQGRMRIVLRSIEQQPTADKLTQIRKVREVVADHFQSLNEPTANSTSEKSPGPLQATASGLFVVMARIIESLLADQMRSFLWASLGTVLCMAIAFRSLRIGLISLVPNVFPIAIVTGSLGLLDIPVNIGTAMIASVSMGFTCSVHYIAVFQKALPELGVSGALSKAQAEVGKAVVLAHIALVAGFLVLTFSEFIPLVYFGALLSLSMVGGLISDLVMLPLLLRWTTPAPLPSQPSAK
jgi:predicted RND superfamily exporter protein